MQRRYVGITPASSMADILSRLTLTHAFDHELVPPVEAFSGNQSPKSAGNTIGLCQ